MSHHNPPSEFCRFGEDRPLQHHGCWLFTDLKTQIWKRTRFSIFTVFHKTRWSGAQPIFLTLSLSQQNAFRKKGKWELSWQFWWLLFLVINFLTPSGRNNTLGNFSLWIMEILRCCRLEGREATGCRGAYEPKKSRWGCDPTSTWSPQSFIARRDSREALFAVVVSEKNYQLSISFQSFTMR